MKRSRFGFQSADYLLNMLQAVVVCMLFVSTGLSAQSGDTAIAVGKTAEEVRNILGNPKGKMTVGAGAVWLYDTSEVSFENGKVVSFRSADVRPAPVPAPAEPAKQAQPAPGTISVPVPVRGDAGPVIPAASTSGTLNSPGANLPDGAKNLKLLWSDLSGDNQSRILCKFKRPALSATALAAQKIKGTIPFQLTVTVMVKAPGISTEKRPWSLVRTGDCSVRIFDEGGNEVFSSVLPVEKLCPS